MTTVAHVVPNQLITSTLWNSTADVIEGLGGWTSYTPTFVSTGTAVNLGTSPTRQGAYAIVGKLCIAQFFIQWGSSPTLGTGSYYIGAPFARSQSIINFPFSFGAAETRDVSVPAKHTGWSMDWIDTQQFTLRWGNGSTNLTLGASASPYTWAVGDQISGYLAYQLA